MIIIAGIMLFAALTFSFRYGWWRATRSYDYPRILMYHMVCEHQPGQAFKGLRVPPHEFEKQIEYLAAQGWNFVTMSELFALQVIPPKTVAITFDDGYEDNLTNALPILQKYNAKATLYLVIDRHDRDWSVNKKAHHNSGELAAEPKLTDDQVHSLLASGVFELGGHTLTHVNLCNADDDIKKREIVDTKQQLEQLFDTKITSFAYPFGLYDAQDVKWVKAAGYLSAVTTEGGVDSNIHANPLELRRVKISGKESLFAFKLRIRTGKRSHNK